MKGLFRNSRLRRYASPRVPVLVRLIAGVGWFTSISIIAIVPIDVWTTLNGGDNDSIFVMWKICYWQVSAFSARQAVTEDTMLSGSVTQVTACHLNLSM